ncbi:MAG: PQQ-dependent sugar dehydrogenase [Gammaproteobacteria bacterium]|nr:PQQ-dependent sugar dehydrogenase [Gammaproteobacteria bacterium]
MVRAILAAFMVLAGQDAHAAATPLADPIPEKIQKGDIVVAVEEFVRVPETRDSSAQSATNKAYARIQYMLPFGYTVGPLVINDLRGVLYLTDVRGSTPIVYLDLREQDVGFDDSMFPNETGVAGIAFHPEFTSIGKPGFGKFYTAYSASSDSGTADYLDDDAASHESVIREWTSDNPRGRVFTGSSREIFRVGQFAPNHNIGTIAFNPIAEVGTADYGLLYASFGDGGAANDPREYGQSLVEPSGAIIRIDPLGGTAGKAYGIPPDNPFVTDPEVAPEIWAYGLRHTQHFSWDTSGRMFLSDIGQNQIEEVNLGLRGANYGWRLREGTFATAFGVTGGEPGLVYPLPEEESGFVYPIAQYDHDEGNAIGGGYLYEGNAIPELRGKFVFVDLVRGRVFYIETNRLVPGDLQEIRELRLSFNGVERSLAEVSSFANSYASGGRVDLRLGIDALGELYLLTKGDGWVRKLVPLNR